MNVVVVAVLCVLALLASPVVGSRKGLNPEFCTVCETLVSGAELLLSQDPKITEAEVEAALNNLCNASVLRPYRSEASA